jgi:predicted NBD/HSP70 family sugar kinase
MLARGIGIATTLFDPELIILSGGALNQSWFDLKRLSDRLPDFVYPGLPMPRVVRASTPDSNLRGAALLLAEHK